MTENSTTAAPRCRRCSAEPVAQPGDPGVLGAFGRDCLGWCHDDDQLGHWCVIDRYADSVETGRPIGPP